MPYSSAGRLFHPTPTADTHSGAYLTSVPSNDMRLSLPTAPATTSDMQAVACSAADADLPPEFYDFTADDYHRVMAGQAHAAAQARAGMRTAAMRRADLEAAAARLGPVSLRVHFPDDIVVQARHLMDCPALSGLLSVM